MIRHKAKLVLAALGTSSALILTACGDGMPDCGSSDVKDTVISIVRDPKELLGFLVRTEFVTNSGPLGQAFLGQWYGKMSAEPWSQRRPKVEAAILGIKERITALESRRARALKTKPQAEAELANCNIQRDASRRASSQHYIRGLPGPAPTPLMKCEVYDQLAAQFRGDWDALPSIPGQIESSLEEISSLEKELSADHPSPPSFTEAIEIKFLSISETERHRTQKTLICEARVAVKLKYPELTDLGIVQLSYKIQPNLAEKGDYIVYVGYD